MISKYLRRACWYLQMESMAELFINPHTQSVAVVFMNSSIVTSKHVPTPSLTLQGRTWGQAERKTGRLGKT